VASFPSPSLGDGTAGLVGEFLLLEGTFLVLDFSSADASALPPFGVALAWDSGFGAVVLLPPFPFSSPLPHAARNKTVMTGKRILIMG